MDRQGDEEFSRPQKADLLPLCNLPDFVQLLGKPNVVKTMLTRKFHSVFVTQIRIFSLYCAIPYRWDKECEKIKPSSIITTWVWKCLALIQIRYAIFLIVRLLQSLMDEEYSAAAKLAIFGWVALHNLSACWYIPLFFKRVEIMEVFNYMIEFETKDLNYPAQNDSKVEEDVVYFLHLASTILTVVVPYVIPFVFWLHPCEPQFLSSMVLTCPTNGHWTWTFLMLKLGFLAVEIVASQQMVLHTIFMIFTCYYLMISSLGAYLEYIKTIRLNHFHFRPRFLKKLALYRRLQLLTTIINECFHTTLLLFKIILSTVIMTLIYFFVKMFRPNSDFPLIGQICIHLSLVAAVGTLYVVYGTAGRIYRNSEILVTQWKRLGQFNSMQWIRLSFQEMQPICIRVGYGTFSFVKPCTWLSVIYFCIKHAVLLLIMSGDHLTE